MMMKIQTKGKRFSLMPAKEGKRKYTTKNKRKSYVYIKKNRRLNFQAAYSDTFYLFRTLFERKLLREVTKKGMHILYVVDEGSWKV